ARMGIDKPHNTWNPDQYGRFKSERSQPFFDLLALVRQRPGMRVVDLGCGPGELTREMHGVLQAESTLGVDASQAMLARSGEHVGPGIAFEPAVLPDLAARHESRGAFDLVLSNATLQWVPDQPAVLARLADMLAPAGQLAVQVPSNEDHPSHATAREIAAEQPFSD